jgi:HlyD family secretion protein
VKRSCAIVLAALLFGCVQTPAPVAEVPVVEVPERETFVRRVKAEGTLQAVKATPISAPAAERPMKIAWLAPDGSNVSEGDVVVKFDATEMERQLADSESDVDAARRQIDKVEIEREATRKNRDATAELAELEKSVSEEFELDDESILSRNEIVESTIDLELADAKARHARSVKKVEGAVAQSRLELHRIGREQAAREVDRASDGLAQLQVRAPHPGILVLARNWRGDTTRVGDTVWQGQKLAELPLVSELEASLFVLEADASSLGAGLPAKVVVEAHPETEYDAEIARVDTLAQPRHPDVPVNYFGVVLKLQRTDPQTMRVGQRVRATILLEEPDAIVVPRQAIFDRDGVSIVYRRDGASFQPVEVTLGPASAGRVVVASGIEPGDVLALADPTEDADAKSKASPPAKEAEP